LKKFFLYIIFLYSLYIFCCYVKTCINLKNFYFFYILVSHLNWFHSLLCTHTHILSFYIAHTFYFIFFLLYSPSFSSKFHQMTNINYLFLLLSIYTKNYILLLLTWEKSTHTHTHTLYLFISYCSMLAFFIYIFLNHIITNINISTSIFKLLL